jgi:hypothetical protein
MPSRFANACCDRFRSVRSRRTVRPIWTRDILQPLQKLGAVCEDTNRIALIMPHWGSPLQLQCCY